MSFKPKESFEYDSVDKTSEGSEGEDDSLMAGGGPRGRHSKSQLSGRPWLFFATIASLTVVGFFAGCGFTYVTMSGTNQGSKYSFEKGYNTEFTSARGAIEVEEVTFTSGLDFHPDGSLYRIADPKGPNYVGPPNADVDANWEVLIHDRYTTVYDEEAAEIGGGIYKNPHSGMYFAGVGVLHTLHCLNEIRKGLYPEYYPPPNPEWNALHVEHCVDHVRQYIQCHGDLTPLPVQYNIEANKLNPDFLQTHTCRNFQKLRDWATNHSLEVKAAHAAEEDLGMGAHDEHHNDEHHR